MPAESKVEKIPVSIDRKIHDLLKKYVEKTGEMIYKSATEAILEYISCVKTSRCNKCDDYRKFYKRASKFFNSLKDSREEDLSQHREETKRKEEDYILKYGKKPKWHRLVGDPRVSILLPRVIYNKAVRMAKKQGKSNKRFIEEAILFRISKEKTCYKCGKYVAFRMKSIFAKEMKNLISLEEE